MSSAEFLVALKPRMVSETDTRIDGTAHRRKRSVLDYAREGLILIVTNLHDHLPDDERQVFTAQYQVTNFGPFSRCRPLCRRGMGQAVLPSVLEQCSTPLGCTEIGQGRRNPLRRPFSVPALSPQPHLEPVQREPCNQVRGPAKFDRQFAVAPSRVRSYEIGQSAFLTA